nr:hypothetical protein OG781_15425 [Streptomyces sp. NBC_00830]
MTAQGNSLLTLDSSGLALPPGGLLHGTLDGTWPEPLLWMSSQAVDEDTWSRVCSAAGRIRRGAGARQARPVVLVGLTDLTGAARCPEDQGRTGHGVR